MSYLVQTKFRNSFKDFHLNECVYVEDFTALEPDEDGVLSLNSYDKITPERKEELESVGLYVLKNKYEHTFIGMAEIKVYQLIEGQTPKDGTSYGWFNYQWLPLRQAKQEAQTFIDIS